MSDPKQPFITGNLCFLRALTLEDANEAYMSWLNDYDVTRYLETGRIPSTLENLRAYIATSYTPPQVVRLAICDKASQQHIGTVSLRNMHPVHHRADLGIMVGDKRFWGKGYATEATFLMVDYGFRRWNLHSIWLGVLVDNVGAVKAYQKVGFKIDGTEREAWWADGKFHDVYHMSILAREHFANLETSQPKEST